MEVTSLIHTSNQHPELTPGGAWKPVTCVQRYPIAVIIPYRDRESHLAVMMNNLHDFLQRQNAHYRIFVVEQVYLYTQYIKQIIHKQFNEIIKTIDN